MGKERKSGQDYQDFLKGMGFYGHRPQLVWFANKALNSSRNRQLIEL
jgi:hypothetical protein